MKRLFLSGLKKQRRIIDSNLVLLPNTLLPVFGAFFNMNKKALWTAPFGYRESFLSILGLLCIGTLLQYFTGTFNFLLLHNPINYIVLGALCILCFLLSKLKNSFIGWLTGIPFSVTLIGAMLFLTLLMGIIPQLAPSAHSHTLIDRLGFSAITRSWQFILCFTVLLLSLGTLSLKRIRVLNKKNIFFFMTHAGLFLALLGAGLGASDMQRFVMYVDENKTEWCVYNENQEAIELPLAIELHDFDMEYYPPKLVLIDRKTGEPLPPDKPIFFQIDPKFAHGQLGDYQLEILTYYQNAVWAGNNEYKEYDMIGSSPAAKIKVTDTKTTESTTGWVTTGNMSQFVSALPLNEEISLVMTKADPKRFLSDITVMTKDGEKVRTTLEVNKPLRLGSWVIYQYGYDEDLGELSPYSSFELVYDPWIYLAYCGLIMLCVGSLFLIWLGKKEISY